MARAIKEHTNVPILFGGIHVTAVPEIVIKEPFVDMICIGEGEKVIVDLVDSMQRGKINYKVKTKNMSI